MSFLYSLRISKKGIYDSLHILWKTQPDNTYPAFSDLIFNLRWDMYAPKRLVQMVVSMVTSNEGCVDDFIFLSFHFKNSLRRGTLQQKCWFSRAPPTKIQIFCMFKRKVVKNLRKNSNLKAKITNFNTLRKKKN